MEKSQNLKKKQIAVKKKQKIKALKESLYPADLEVPHYVIGIDPGLKGAITLLEQDILTRQISVINTFDCPLMAGGLTKKARENPKSMTFDLYGMLRTLRKLTHQYNLWDFQVFIEQSQVMSKGGRQQGSVSNFTIGYGYGLWRMALASFCFQWVHTISPIEWTRRLFNSEHYKSMKGTKERSISYVKERFPGISLLPEDNKRVTKDRDGRADAIAIACYGIERYMWDDR